MPTIRDTIDPTREREVSEAEFTDLSRQNAVLTGTRAHTPDGLRAAAVRQVEQHEADRFAAAGVTAGDGQAVVVTPDGVEHVGVLPVSAADADYQTPGGDPVSTADDTDHDDPQES